MTTAQRHFPIRSFVRREGRMTPAQKRSIEDTLPRYGIDPAERALPFAPDECFAQNGPLILEIGFGYGDSVIEQATANQDARFIGIEVHRPGVGHLLHRIESAGLENVRVVCDDAVSVLTHLFIPGRFDRIQIFFPDPWPKKRHHKRRLIQAPFVHLLAEHLKPGGQLHLATDWLPYAEQMLEVLRNERELINDARDYTERPDHRPLTKFERRGLDLGHSIRDLVFHKPPLIEQVPADES